MLWTVSEKYSSSLLATPNTPTLTKMALKLVVFSCMVAVARCSVGHAALAAAPVAVAAPLDYDPYPQYRFGYDVADSFTGDYKTQNEQRDGDVVQGQYTVVDPDGTRRIVDYAADPVNGFNAVVRKEPLVAGPVVAEPAVVSARLAAAPVAAPAVVAARYAAPAVYAAPAKYAAPAPVFARYAAAPAPVFARYAAAPAPVAVAAPAPLYARYAAAPVVAARYAAPAAAAYTSYTYAAPGPAPLTYAAPAPAPLTYAASAPAPLTYAAPAPAPLYAAPAPAKLLQPVTAAGYRYP